LIWKLNHIKFNSVVSGRWLVVSKEESEPQRICLKALRDMKGEKGEVVGEGMVGDPVVDMFVE